MIALPMHDDHVHEGDAGQLVGSALYDVLPMHAPALAVMVGTPLVALAVWALRRQLPLAGLSRLLAASTPERRVAIAALAWSALIHLAIVPAHGLSGESLAFAVDTALLGWAAWWLLLRRRGAVVLASVALTGSLLGLAVSSLSGETPDQVAMACKIVELVGLVALWAPLRSVRLGSGRVRRFLGTVAVSGLAIAVAVPAWAAALDAGGGGHHMAGGAATVGTLMHTVADEEVTAQQREAADQLFERAAAAIAPYADIEVAEAAGYDVGQVRGSDHHASSPQYSSDGRILDPERPENIIYAQTAAGPVLLGAMFEMQDLNDTGPAIGGALTMWHGHEQVCFGPFPPSLAGLTSPFGLCPIGSITVARTSEMMHVWTAPGAPERFGDLPDEWRADYLANITS